MFRVEHKPLLEKLVVTLSLTGHQNMDSQTREVLYNILQVSADAAQEKIDARFLHLGVARRVALFVCCCDGIIVCCDHHNPEENT